MSPLPVESFMREFFTTDCYEGAFRQAPTASTNRGSSNRVSRPFCIINAVRVPGASAIDVRIEVRVRTTVAEIWEGAHICNGERSIRLRCSDGQLVAVTPKPRDMNIWGHYPLANQVSNRVVPSAGPTPGNRPLGVSPAA